MAQFTKTFVQDLTQDIRIRQCGSIVFNADDLSNVISVNLYNGDEPYSGGGTVAGACICPDGSTVALVGSLSGNTASVTLTGDCFAITGQIGIGIQVINGTTKTTVLKAIYTVEPFDTNTVVDPGSRIALDVGDLVQDIADAVATIPADYTDLMAAVAPTFDSTKYYLAGQYAWNDGKLYRFTAAHPAGTWAGTDAELVPVSDALYNAQVLAEDNRAYLNAISNGNLFTRYGMTLATSISGTGEFVGIKSSAVSAEITVEPSTEYTISAVCGEYPSSWKIRVCDFTGGSYVSEIGSGFSVPAAGGTVNGTLTTPAGCSTIRIWFYRWYVVSDVVLKKADGVITAIDSVARAGVTTNASAIETKQDVLTFDTTPTQDSTNPVTSGGVYTALNTKQDTLTFDTTPTAGSTNPVTSNGIRADFEIVDNRLDESETFYTLGREISYPESGTSNGDIGTARRNFFPYPVPANSILKTVSIPCYGTTGNTNYVTVETWELESDGDTLTKTETRTIDSGFVSGTDIVFEFDSYSEKARYVCFYQYGLYCKYGNDMAGYTFRQITRENSDEQSTILLSALSTQTDKTLQGTLAFRIGINHDFFSAWHSGNVIVFGDSTVDGASITGHTGTDDQGVEHTKGNTIGTIRATDYEPYCFTSVMEVMLQKFIGDSTKRIFNGGFAGKTLDWIADNYFQIMLPYKSQNVTGALLVVDANSASTGPENYKVRIRSGLERMVNYLAGDGIAIAIASPQPMVYTSANDKGLPSINGAGEFAIGVKIAQDICNKYGLPFINFGEITNSVMNSPYFRQTDFYGDLVHFNEGGHKFEGYELYGEMVHPVLYFDGKSKYVFLASNKGELNQKTGYNASMIDGYQVIRLSDGHTRLNDILHRIYVVAKEPFKITGIPVTGWVANYTVYVDIDEGSEIEEGDNANFYTRKSFGSGETISAGCHVITVKPSDTNRMIYAGLVFEQP